MPSPGVPACFTALIALRVAQPIRSARTPFFVLAHVVQSQDEATKAAARFDAIALGVARDLGGEDQLSTVQKQLVEAFAGIALDDHGDCIGCGGRCRLRSNRGEAARRDEHQPHAKGLQQTLTGVAHLYLRSTVRLRAHITSST